MKHVFDEMNKLVSDMNDTLDSVKRPYHNTTGETGAKLKGYVNQAKSQDADVLAYFKANPSNDRVTPEKVHCYLSQVMPRKYDDPTVIISIRRSFNTLMNAGHIEKTGVLIDGIKGRRVNSWRLAQ
jgi:hypothetical protein